MHFNFRIFKRPLPVMCMPKMVYLMILSKCLQTMSTPNVYGKGLSKKRLVRASVIFTTLFSQKIKVLISIYLTIVYMFFSTQIRLMKIMVSMMCWHWRSGPSKSGVKNIVWKHLFALKNAKMICF